MTFFVNAQFCKDFVFPFPLVLFFRYFGFLTFPVCFFLLSVELNFIVFLEDVDQGFPAAPLAGNFALRDTLLHQRLIYEESRF